MDIAISHFGSNQWFEFKYDIIYGLYHSLRRLGYSVRINHNQLSSRMINILIGADWMARLDVINYMIQKEISYLIYEVENYESGIINNRVGFEVELYSQLIQGSVLVLTPYRHNINSYAENGFGSKIHYMPWGFYDELINKNINRDDYKLYEGVFYGMPKGDRLDKLKYLMTTHSIAISDMSTPFMQREYFINKSNYAISLTASGAERFVNPFRIFYLLSNGVDIIADNCIDYDGYLDGLHVCNVTEMGGTLAKEPRQSSELRNLAASRSLLDSVADFFSQI